jgi:ACR3 family arsenite efflux pump ArsB
MMVFVVDTLVILLVVPLLLGHYQRSIRCKDATNRTKPYQLD